MLSSPPIPLTLSYPLVDEQQQQLVGPNIQGPARQRRLHCAARAAAGLAGCLDHPPHQLAPRHHIDLQAAKRKRTKKSWTQMPKASSLPTTAPSHCRQAGQRPRSTAAHPTQSRRKSALHSESQARSPQCAPRRPLGPCTPAPPQTRCAASRRTAPETVSGQAGRQQRGKFLGSSVWGVGTLATSKQ